jgi:hypothetical protein
VFLTLKAEFSVSSLCDCVAQRLVRTLNSRSSTVRLLRIKKRSFRNGPVSFGVLADFVSGALGAGVDAVTPFSPVSSLPAMLGSCVDPACGDDAAGPVGAVRPAGPSTVLFRNRLTKRTVMNLESCNFF